MRRRTGWYDPKILEAVGDCLYIPAAEESADAVKPSLTVSFSNLQIGQLLVSDIQTMDGTLIVCRRKPDHDPIDPTAEKFFHAFRHQGADLRRSSNNKPATTAKWG